MDSLDINKEYIRSILQTIVDKHHSHPQKRYVKEKANGMFQIACPYCGDSHKNPNKYRGNLNDFLFYKCFNDGCGIQTHFTKMCKDFDITIEGETKQKIYDYLDSYTNKVDTLQDELNEHGLNNLISLEKLEECINSSDCDTQLSDFKPIQKGSAQYFYLIEKRGLDPKLFKNIYQANFHITGDWIEKSIIYLNRRGNKIIGMQLRNMKDGYRRKFKIYTYSDLYEIAGETEVSDGQLMMYDKLSYYYGILELDFSKKITIFEGYGDAILYPNSIGLAGVNTDMKFMENNGLDIRYFYDNDKGGHQKSEEKIKNNIPCFLWNKLFGDIVNKKSSHNPYKHLRKISTVKDLTKLNLLVPNCYEKLELEKYFSVDKFDLKYIPKFKKYEKFK